MDRSRFLAGLIGPTLIVVALSLGLNLATFRPCSTSSPVTGR